ncbi:MAG: DUF2066 domain-containing protein [Succinivibrionaceae bacterium]
MNRIKMILKFALVPISTMLFLSNVLAESDDIYVSDMDNSIDKKNSENINSKKVKYSVVVDFNGDYDESHDLALQKLVKDLSNGLIDGSNIKIDADSLIDDEIITDDYQLKVIFNDKKIDNLLHNGLIPVWYGLPEPLLFWLVKGVEVKGLDSDGNVTTRIDAKIVSADEENDIIKKIKKVGFDNGINVVFPINDLQDMEAVNVSSVIKSLPEEIIIPSLRYTKGYVTTALLNEKDGVFELIATIINCDEKSVVYSTTLKSEDVDVLLNNFINEFKRVVGSIEAEKNSKTQSTVVTTGFDNTDNLKLGLAEKNKYRVLIRNVSDFSNIMKIQSNLEKIGLMPVVLDVKGGDVLFLLKYDSPNSISSFLSMYKALISFESSEFIYIYDDEKSDILEVPELNSDQERKNEEENNENSSLNTETDAKNHYNNRSQNEPVLNNKFPDPNRKLKTGGGLVK